MTDDERPTTPEPGRRRQDRPRPSATRTRTRRAPTKTTAADERTGAPTGPGPLLTADDIAAVDAAVAALPPMTDEQIIAVCGLLRASREERERRTSGPTTTPPAPRASPGSPTPPPLGA